MISTENVIKIHEILIEKFGGAKGLRDLALLESALFRPYQTFGGIELHDNEFQRLSGCISNINHS